MSEVQQILAKAFTNPTTTTTTTTTKALPSVQSITDLPETTYNASYKITLETSQSYFLKISPAPDVRVLRYEADIHESEADILRLLRQRAPQVPVPRVLLHDDSREIVESPYVLLSHIPGVSLRELRTHLTARELAAVELSVGRYLRVLADITPSSPGPTSGFGRATRRAKRYGSWREAFSALVESVLSDGEETLVLLPYQELRAQFRRWAFTLDEVLVPGLAVLDFGDGDVLVDPGTREVVGLVDFERAGWYDPLLCAAVFAPSPAFVEGYGADALDSSGARVRRLLYSCYYSCVKVVGAYYHEMGDCNEMEERKNLMRPLNELVNLTE